VITFYFREYTPTVTLVMLYLTCVERLDTAFTNLRQHILHTSLRADEHVHPPGQLVSSCIAKDNDSQRLFFWHMVFVKISSS